MPYLEDLGFSQFLRRDSVDLTTQIINSEQYFPDLSLSADKIEDLNVGHLTAGTITSETITLTVTDGAGDCWIAAGKTDFTNVTSGFILGLDDSDGNKAKLYIGDSTHYFNWDGAAVVLSGGQVLNIAPGSETSIQGWQFDATFTATDYNTVAWTAGTIRLLDSTTYSIGSSNTGNISALTYIYFDKNVSQTALQTTTTAANAVGSGKILIAVAQNNSDTTKDAIFQVYGGTGGMSPLITADNIAANSITGNEIAANSITTNHIVAGTIVGSDIAASTITASNLSVTTLSAISADLGTITAGTITMPSTGWIKGGQTDYNTGTGFFLGYSGAAYKFSLGNASTDYLTWDGTALNYSGQMGSPIGLLGQFDPKVRWTPVTPTSGGTMGADFNTSKSATDSYLYVACSGSYEGTTYHLWRFQFTNGVWTVVNKATLTGWTSGGNTAGIIKIGSYVYVGDRQNQEIQRYDLDLTNRQIMTKKNVPDIYQMIPGFHNGMATDSSDNLYILGYDSETLYADHYVYKFSISGTDLNYQSRFKFYDNGESDYLFDCNLGCDGTYLYINLGGGADQSNADKFVRRYVLDGSSYTDFSYTCSSYPYETGNSYAKKRNICVGIFRIQNKWWITEFYATQMIRNFSPSTGSIWANQYCFYLKNVTF